MDGVPGVFWRCPAFLQGPSTHNPTWILRKIRASKKMADLPSACEIRVNLPNVAKHAFGDQMAPNVQNSLPQTEQGLYP